MRADRLLSILMLLQSYGQITAKDLAQRLEVSERTIYRDMESLSGSGIPVLAERGSSGGWRLLEDYQTTLTGLKESEIQALFVPSSTRLLNDLDLTKTEEEAKNKLLAALPSNYRQNAKDVWQRIHIDTSSWRQRTEKIASFETLKHAIWQKKKLLIQYERADGKTVERLVEPLGLVAKGSVWYFVASTDDNIRNYRVSRIQSAVPTEESFFRPDDFNLAKYWEQSTKEFIKKLPKYEVKAEVSPSILPRLKFTGRFVQIIEMDKPNEDGWIPVKLCFETEEEASGYALGFGDQMKVVEPHNLQDQVLKMAEAAVKLYKISPHGENF